MRQFRLRGRNVAVLADFFLEGGFSVVIDDVVISSRLEELRSDVHSRPLYLVLLFPRLEKVRHRNATQQDRDVLDVSKHLHEVAFRETPRMGLWIDTSDQTPEESVLEILARVRQEGEIP